MSMPPVEPTACRSIAIRAGLAAAVSNLSSVWKLMK